MKKEETFMLIFGNTLSQSQRNFQTSNFKTL